MLSAKNRGSFQRIVVGAMVFAMFGFAFMRWFRLEETPKSSERITFDTDLRDQLHDNRVTLISKKTNNADLEFISDRIDQTETLFKIGQKNRSIEVLGQAEERAKELASEKDNPDQEFFSNISGQLFEIEGNLKHGEKETAIREMRALFVILNTEGQKAEN